MSARVLYALGGVAALGAVICMTYLWDHSGDTARMAWAFAGLWLSACGTGAAVLAAVTGRDKR